MANPFKFEELDYTTFPLDVATLNWVKKPLPDFIQENEDGRELHMVHITLDNKPFTLSEVSGAYQNPGAYIAPGHLDFDLVLQDFIDDYKENM